MNFKEKMQSFFKKAEADLSEEQAQLLTLYKELFLAWNEKINLTSITDDEGIIEKHYFDSIYILEKFDLKANASFVDIGAGGGFPSIPIKIMRPDLEVLMVDSVGKRVKVLDDMIAKLSLTGISAIHARAEELGKDPAYREKFDYATARAVTKMRELAEYTLPLVEKGGKFIAMKSGNIDEELLEANAAIKTLGGKVQEKILYSLPSGDERSLIIIDKTERTKMKYPRANAQIKKNPII